MTVNSQHHHSRNRRERLERTVDADLGARAAPGAHGRPEPDLQAVIELGDTADVGVELARAVAQESTPYSARISILLGLTALGEAGAQPRGRLHSRHEDGNGNESATEVHDSPEELKTYGSIIPRSFQIFFSLPKFNIRPAPQPRMYCGSGKFGYRTSPHGSRNLCLYRGLRAGMLTALFVESHGQRSLERPVHSMQLLAYFAHSGFPEVVNGKCMSLGPAFESETVPCNLT
ncbi:hypothetical protein FB451DRAFT_1185810 [Mycena latifolia]|nr:hypothetical protein FB451DRAFT_1185810 [Mycena latifolia]